MISMPHSNRPRTTSGPAGDVSTRAHDSDWNAKRELSPGKSTPAAPPTVHSVAPSTSAFSRSGGGGAAALEDGEEELVCAPQTPIDALEKTRTAVSATIARCIRVDRIRSAGS